MLSHWICNLKNKHDHIILIQVFVFFVYNWNLIFHSLQNTISNNTLIVFTFSNEIQFEIDNELS